MGGPGSAVGPAGAGGILWLEKEGYVIGPDDVDPPIGGDAIGGEARSGLLRCPDRELRTMAGRRDILV